MPNGNETNYVCKEHSGFEERLKDCEGNVIELWDHWNGMQKTIMGIFIALSMNLLGVVIILVMNFLKPS